MEDLNHTDICWNGSTSGYKESTRLMEYVRDNFLTQMVKMQEGYALQAFFKQEAKTRRSPEVSI